MRKGRAVRSALPFVTMVCVESIGLLDADVRKRTEVLIVERAQHEGVLIGRCANETIEKSDAITEMKLAIPIRR